MSAPDATSPALVPELYCVDVKASLAFYVGVLGFRVKYDRPEEGFAMIARGGACIMLDQIGKTRDWLPAPLEHPFGRGINFQIMVEDVEALYQTCLDHGADIFLPLETKSYRVGDKDETVCQFIVKDPDGYLLRLQQDL